MNHSGSQNFPILSITKEISLTIEPIGVVFKKQITLNSGYKFQQEKSLSFGDFLKFSTYIRDIDNWSKNMQCVIECLEQANKSQGQLDGLPHLPEIHPVKLSSESAIFLTVNEGKNQYSGRWFVNVSLSRWKHGISFNQSDLKVMRNRLWEICGILRQISLEHLHYSF